MSESIEDFVDYFMDKSYFTFKKIHQDRIEIVKFWISALILFIFSVIFTIFIAYIPNISYSLGNHGVPDLPFFTPFIDHPVPVDIYFMFKINNESIGMLTTLSQIQAAIFGIWFTVILLIYNIQISNKAASPSQIKTHLSSKRFIFIFIVLITSIMLDLTLARYATDELNIFWILVIFVYGILLLSLYTYNMINIVSKYAIKEEILGRKARYNLSGSDLSMMNLDGIDLEDRDFTNCDLRFSTFKKATLTSAIFARTDLRHVKLNGADLTRAVLIACNLKGTNFNGADIAKTRFGVCEDHVRGYIWSNLFTMASRNWFLKKIIFNPLRMKIDLHDLKHGKDNGASDEYIICDFFNLVASSRLARNATLTANSILEIIAPYISRSSYVKYDELTIKNLLYAKNLDKATFCGPIKEDLIEKSKELIQEDNIDSEVKISLEAFLNLEDMALIERPEQ